MIKAESGGRASPHLHADLERQGGEPGLGDIKSFKVRLPNAWGCMRCDTGLRAQPGLETPRESSVRRHRARRALPCWAARQRAPAPPVAASASRTGVRLTLKRFAELPCRSTCSGGMTPDTISSSSVLATSSSFRRDHRHAPTTSGVRGQFGSIGRPGIRQPRIHEAI